MMAIKNKYTMKSINMIAVGIIITMVVLQFVMLMLNNSREAKSSTSAYLTQVETIIEKDDQEEETLLSSLKNEYTILAKAVAYYLDHNTAATYDAKELQKICSLMSIDEIHIFNTAGSIVSSSIPRYVGYTLFSGEQIGYFLPMLSDKSLTLCQDMTPNTADGKPMVYAMTWNELGTQMVQVGIEPVRLMQELEENNIETTIKGIALDENMTVIAADASTLEVVGAQNEEYLGQQLSKVTSLDDDDLKKGFVSKATLDDQQGLYYCSARFTDDYCLCVFLNHRYFYARTAEFVFATFFYILAATLIILTVFRRLMASREENYQHLQVFQSMSEIYYSLHLLDLKNDTTTEYTSRNQVKEAFVKDATNKATVIMPEIMKATMSDEYLQRGLEFADITTLSERMRGKKVISMELLGKNVGWIRMSFIAVETEGDLPVKAIIATQIIDEEKKAAQSLYEKSHMDELTNCYNRRAYSEDVAEYHSNASEDEFAYISFDVNGLKTVNDDLGHEAGDELIRGAASCMKKAFLKHGRVYRVGGDEFVGLVHADAGLLKMLCEDFDEQISCWCGLLVKEISVSYGCVLSSEVEGMSMTEIASLADKRMYESKAKHYEEKGIERRRT